MDMYAFLAVRLCAVYSEIYSVVIVILDIQRIRWLHQTKFCFCKIQ